MKTALERIKQTSLPIEYVRRLQADPDGGFVASVLEFPGCIAYGATSDEALKNLDSAADSWILAMKAAGQPIPPPSNFEECSGKIALRISRGLHAQAAEMAAREGVSLNHLISVALASYLSKKDMADEIKEAIRATLQRVSNQVQIRKPISNAQNQFIEIGQSRRSTDYSNAAYLYGLGNAQLVLATLSDNSLQN